MFILVILYLGLCSASIVVSQRIEFLLSHFLSKNSVITNEVVLSEYKSTVRKCMHLTLAQIGIIIAGLCVCIGFIWYRGFSGAFAITLLGGALGFGQEAAKLEEKAKTLDCANNDLEKEYKKICNVWGKKPLPDF
ncbi:MAG: hypothetical protein AAF316_03790 [Cyanobacteria bacterium P01_A01_bin.80]